MRISHVLSVIICLVAVAFLQSNASAVEGWTPDSFEIAEVKIPMADGGALAADVYVPGKGTYSTMLVITMASKTKAREQQLTRSSFFNSGDYAVVCVERRGSLGSSDNPIREGINPDGHDGHDVVEWIARQQWSNGKVGMWGASNQGKIQYATAMTNPPHLVCIMPAETRPETREQGNPGLHYDRVFPGGVLRLEMFQKGQRSREAKAGQPGGSLPRQISDHYLDDGFFGKRPEGAPTLADVKIPIMAVGSWFDNDINRSTTGLFNKILATTPEAHRKDHRLLVGPWTHTGVYIDGLQGQMEFDNAAERYKAREKQFIDYWLRGVKNGEDTAPVVTYYQMGKNEWRTSDVWPVSRLKDVSFYLQPDGGLSLDKASAKAAPDRFVSDPENPTPTVGGQNKQPTFGKGPYDQSEKVEGHDDVLVYTSPVLKEDVTVVGDVNVKVFVSSDSEDTDVSYRLTDVFPSDGRSMLLRDGIIRMSLRRTRKQYEFLTAGKVYEADIWTIPIAYTFLKGHQIRLIISSTNYPRYDINTNTRDKTGEPKVAVNKLYHDSSHPSMLSLSVQQN